MKRPEKEGEKLIVKNRRATFDYDIEDRYEGGLVLKGSEVKSMREGRVDIVDAFGDIDAKGEVWLKQLRVAATEQATAWRPDPLRARKVLLHAREIEQIHKVLSRKGYTLVPTRLYFKDGRVKVELALAKGKRTFDKRQDIAKKTADREARAAIVRGRRSE